MWTGDVELPVCSRAVSVKLSMLTDKMELVVSLQERLRTKTEASRLQVTEVDLCI